MAKTEKIARGVNLIEEHIFDSILDFQNHSYFSGKKIECIDDSDEDELQFELSFMADEDKELSVIISINPETETFKINEYEDSFSEFTSFDFSVGKFWRVLFLKALDT